MTVVYVDSVFVLNGLMDYLLLLVTARLAGIPLRRRRYLLAALAGAAYAVAVFLPGMGFLSAPPVKAAAGVLMALIAYGGEARLARLTLLFFALSCALAGSVLALGLLAGGGVPVTRGVFYTDVDARVLLAAATAASSPSMDMKSTPRYSFTASAMVSRRQPGVRSISSPCQVT